jgi:hypothetical protein
MDEFGRAALREREAVRIARRQWFWMDLIVWAAISVFLFVIWLLAGAGFPWFVIPVGAWGIVVVAHAAFAFVLRSPEDILLEREERERNRAETVEANVILTLQSVGGARSHRPPPFRAKDRGSRHAWRTPCGPPATGRPAEGLPVGAAAV